MEDSEVSLKIPLPRLIKSLKAIPHFKAYYIYENARKIEVEIHLHDLMVRFHKIYQELLII